MAITWESPPSSLHMLLKLKVLEEDGSNTTSCEKEACGPTPSPPSPSANRCAEGPLTTILLLKGMITAIGGLKRGSEPPVNE